MKQKFKPGDIYIPVIMMLMSGYVFISARGFRREPGLFPMIVSVISFVIALILLYNGILKLKEKRGDQEQPAQKPKGKDFWATVMALILYPVCIFTIGYFPATIVFFVASFFLYNYRNYKVAALFVVGMPLFIYLLFVVALNVKLPVGVFFGGVLY